MIGMVGRKSLPIVFKAEALRVYPSEGHMISLLAPRTWKYHCLPRLKISNLWMFLLIENYLPAAVMNHASHIV